MAETYRLIVDGLNIDATHYAALSEDEMVKKMKKDGVEVPGKDDAEKEAWMRSTYAKLKDHVEKQTAKEAGTKDLKTVTKEMQQSAKAESAIAAGNK